jgi:hypothetical protein
MKLRFVTWILTALLAFSLARADETPQANNNAKENPTSAQTQREQPEEEFKIRYKKPKQRHDDDAAPVPKFSRPDSANAPDRQHSNGN